MTHPSTRWRGFILLLTNKVIQYNSAQLSPCAIIKYFARLFGRGEGKVLLHIYLHTINDVDTLMERVDSLSL